MVCYNRHVKPAILVPNYEVGKREFRYRKKTVKEIFPVLQRLYPY